MAKFRLSYFSDEDKKARHEKYPAPEELADWVILMDDTLYNSYANQDDALAALLRCQVIERYELWEEEIEDSFGLDGDMILEILLAWHLTLGEQKALLEARAKEQGRKPFKEKT